SEISNDVFFLIFFDVLILTLTPYSFTKLKKLSNNVLRSLFLLSNSTFLSFASTLLIFDNLRINEFTLTFLFFAHISLIIFLNIIILLTIVSTLFDEIAVS